MSLFTVPRGTCKRSAIARLTEAGVERQLEDLAGTGGQRGQRIGDQQPLDQVGRFGVDRRAALGVGLVAMRLRCAGLGAVGVVDAVAGDAEQPSRQAPEGRVEPLTGPPGADERLLDAVGGEVAIAERADAKRVDEGAVAVPDATSCPVVACGPGSRQRGVVLPIWRWHAVTVPSDSAAQASTDAAVRRGRWS